MRSVVGEKENRTAEVLLLSLEPRELMAGKILAMTVVLVVQLVIWVGGGMLALGQGASLLNLPDLTFPPGFVAWAETLEGWPSDAAMSPLRCVHAGWRRVTLSGVTWVAVL